MLYRVQALRTTVLILSFLVRGRSPLICRKFLRCAKYPFTSNCVSLLTSRRIFPLHRLSQVGVGPQT